MQQAAHIAKNVSMAISSLSDACIIIADAQSARLKLHKRVGAETQYCYPEFLEVANLYGLEMGWELETALDLNKSFLEFFYLYLLCYF